MSDTIPSAIASSPHTVRLHRVIKCPPDRLYRAFVDPRALVKWMAPHGFVVEVHAMDARVGGSYKMSFTNFNTGHTHSFGGTYVEMSPGQALRYTDKFDDASMPGDAGADERHNHVPQSDGGVRHGTDDPAREPSGGWPDLHE